MKRRFESRCPAMVMSVVLVWTLCASCETESTDPRNSIDGDLWQPPHADVTQQVEPPMTREVGESCEEDQDCVSRACVDGACSPKCNGDDECAALPGTCCSYSIRRGYAVCMSDNQMFPNRQCGGSCSPGSTACCDNSTAFCGTDTRYEMTCALSSVASDPSYCVPFCREAYDCLGVFPGGCCNKAPGEEFGGCMPDEWCNMCDTDADCGDSGFCCNDGIGRVCAPGECCGIGGYCDPGSYCCGDGECCG